mmetsp:Transcript_34658/g.79035  ORF Transcript_34658/g.79035 Transcript_34658/m.79035 type:complete len:127 (+) Transcript_34658:79-459(+)|eukprot:CAMPEP_0114542370 /NCGR_PEP_ID=MMETSP0114-20121206/1802_1 /TAXON_ID=31324 /ORGANISM="Goniomonas sp, Strain m" /LENGTH=126 /DNA_ID=CAMNT_0001726669 /DNA_START=79 /DNA_END=459 /DNA_ORIENTATION=+
MATPTHKELGARLDRSCDEMRLAFSQLLNDAKTFDALVTTNMDLGTDLHAQNLVNSSETLLTLISELKTMTVVNDARACNNLIDSRVKTYNSEQLLAEKAILDLRDDVAEALRELETSYYSSKYRR